LPGPPAGRPLRSGRSLLAKRQLHAFSTLRAMRSQFPISQLHVIGQPRTMRGPY
jgi:hypothetical protein